MPYGIIPEQFREVDLQDRRTWHRATMREWLDHRFFLKEKKSSGESSGELQLLSEWESKFLYVTDCLEEALVEYERGLGAHNTMALIFNWLVTLEEQLDLSTKRFNKRKQNRESVAAVTDRQLKSRRNPFYPRPPELIHIDAVMTILIANTIRDFKIYHSYPDPDFQDEYQSDLTISAFVKINPAKQRILRLLNKLKGFGYLLHAEEEQILEWEGWTKALDHTPRATNRQLLSFMFEVQGDTIQRDLAKGNLKMIYDEMGLRDPYRVYIEKNKTPESGSIYRSGWTSRLEKGKPSIFDKGPIYNLLPTYDASDR
jgi:hypothetical protein